MRSFIGLLAVLAVMTLINAASAQLSFEDEPINYGTAEVHDPIAVLQSKIDSGEVQLKHDDQHGYLASLLELLEVPPSSQMLVFSKTSFQLRKINPRHPRALYIRDDVYVGWVQHGDVIEVVSVDPRQGPIFYTLDQERAQRPKFLRDKGQCLTCHASSRTQGVPGLLVRSVFVGRSGQPMLGSGTYTINHASPLEQRWGGWYVTGTHGEQRHLGNEVVASKLEPETIDQEAGANVTDLSERIDVKPYLSPHSDLVALMVLEHQSEMQNRITGAGFEARSVVWYDSVMNEALDRPVDHVSESAERRINAAVDKLVKYMLFCGETKLTAPIAGTSDFAKQFAERGRRDARNRSLRDFDLRTRLFKYPCSFLIYSPSFDGLPEIVKERVYRQIRAVLKGENKDPAFAHLSPEDRTAIAEILSETKAGLPDDWVAR